MNGKFTALFLVLVSTSLTTICAEEAILLYDYYYVDATDLHIKPAGILKDEFMDSEKVLKLIQLLPPEKVALAFSGSCVVNDDQVVSATMNQKGGVLRLTVKSHFDKHLSALSISEIDFSMSKVNNLSDYRHAEKYEDFYVPLNGHKFPFAGHSVDNESGEVTKIRMLSLSFQIRK